MLPFLSMPHSSNLPTVFLKKILAVRDRQRITAIPWKSSCNHFDSRLVGSVVRHPLTALCTPGRAVPLLHWANLSHRRSRRHVLRFGEEDPDRTIFRSCGSTLPSSARPRHVPCCYPGYMYMKVRSWTGSLSRQPESSSMIRLGTGSIA